MRSLLLLSVALPLLGACTLICPDTASQPTPQLAAIGTGRPIQSGPFQAQPVVATPVVVAQPAQPVATAVQGDRCKATVDSLQAQDTYLKALVYGTSSPEHKDRNARIAQTNLRIGLDSLNAGVCPQNIASGLVPQVQQRIGQIDSYLTSKVWSGPVG